MGAFRYCINRKCNDGDCRALSKPTPQEDLLEGQKCPICDTEQPRIYSTEEWVVEAFDEIEALKKKFNKAFTKLATKNGARVRRLENKIKALEKRVNELEAENDRTKA